MPILESNAARFLFEIDGSSADLAVIGISGTEAISELFYFNLEIMSMISTVDLDAVVGQPAHITILSELGTRMIHGIVRRMEQGVRRGEGTPCFVEVVPSVWVLTQMMKSRIFQEMNTEDIIRQVLTDAGIATDRFRFALSGSYDPRTYCVQYRETDWNFIARLMEEEGIFFFFEHTDDGDVLVMADSADVHVPIEGPSTIVFRHRSGEVEGREFIYDFRYSQQLRPGKATLKDFNFETPSLGLLKDEAAERNPEFEVYDYPGLYGDETRGGILAGLRLESTQALRLVGQGHSICSRLISGSIFSLDDFPNSDLNQDYLIVSVHHEGSQPLGPESAGGHYSYNNTFKCIPSTIPYRPIRRTPKPVVEGSQTAIVTGPSGEEIFTDEYGRVKVQFHWDREGQNDEHSSCWIRVSQLWAGAGWGAMFIPRIGHEVIVDFIEGDPDRPIITGRVYHGENLPPYQPEEEKTKSTIKSDSSLGGGGSNEIRFEDKAGEEEVFIHAQKDYTIRTENDKSQSTGHNESLSVGNDRTKTVGNNETTTVEVNREETVNGTETITIKGDRTETVSEGDETITISLGDRTVNVDTGDDTHNVKTGDRTVNVDTGDDALNVKAGKRNETVAQDIIVTSEQSKIHITAATEIKLEVGSSTLLMKSDGTIELSGVNLAIEGSASVNIHGLSVTSSADADHNIQGAIVVSDGSATNTVRGGMVMLNP